MAPVPARFNLAKYCLSENARLRPDHIALTIVGDELGSTMDACRT
jgi:hypothetical protein